MIASDVKLGKNVKVWHDEIVNLYGCTIGDNCHIGSFVEIGKGVKVGKGCLIQAYAYICEGVTLEEDVFVGQGVLFINDPFPPSDKRGETIVGQGASIGAGSIIMCGITIGRKAMIGAGSVVTKNIPPYAIAYGNPAKVKRWINENTDCRRH